MIKRSLLLGALCGSVSILATGAGWAQTDVYNTYNSLPEMQVQAPPVSYYPGNQKVSPQNMDGPQRHDGGSFLADLPGVSASRMGGHGLEPVIRGQQQGQLNILLDGAYIHGGCPNRMDPPASFANVESYDEVSVLHGYQTVQHGPGGSGGTILFERTPRNYEGDGVQWTALLDAGLDSNGWVRSALGDLTVGTEEAQLRSVISAGKGNNYEDGNGNEVRSGFRTKSVMLSPTWHMDENTDLTLGMEAARTQDALFEGAGMDAPEDLSVTYRAKLKHEWREGLIESFRAEGYKTLVNHLMDNFSLRVNTGMKMKTKADSDTFGGKFSVDVAAANSPVTMGVNHHDNRRDAKRYSGMAVAADATTPQSYLWPDATISQTGLFAEKTVSVAPATRLKLGGRYDYVRADADAADQLFDGVRSANTLYQLHYGYRAGDVTEHNLGGLARLEFDLSDEATLFAGASRSVRTADTTERYMAAWSGVAGSRWVGNPRLDPEAHRQLDAGVMLDKPLWHLNASVYYDDVRDFIMRDRARGQDGILVAGNETVYRNIDATLAGVELDAHYDMARDWKVTGNMTYTYGENDDDGDALAQIPPLEGQLGLRYAPDKWSFGGRANFAMKQSRIDDNTSLRDAQKTPGYVTVDFYGSYDINEAARLHFGIDNVFDKDYAHHLNRSNSFDPTETQVNEPGRSFYLRVSAKF